MGEAEEGENGVHTAMTNVEGTRVRTADRNAEEAGERRGNRAEDKEAKAYTGKAKEEGEPRARTGSRAAMVERARVFARTPMVTVLKDPGKEPLAETQTPAECAPGTVKTPWEIA